MAVGCAVNDDGAPAGDGGGSSTGSSSTGGGGAGGAAGCAAVVCDGPGEVCDGGACVVDCRRPGATPCAAPAVCDVSDASPGECVAPDAPCATTSVPEPCGGAKVCGPGSFCDGAGQCWPRVPCATVACEGDACWGTSCACTRVIGCSPAPVGAPGEVGTLNDPAFAGGLVDLDFDPACGAWGATLISGPDYLRSMSPAGVAASIAGITNLNMGEVAVLQQIAVPRSHEGVWPLDAPALDVSLAYICCAACGCQLDSTPQGVARLDPVTQALPLVIPSQTFTSGAGPFGAGVIDTGPAGLAYGLDRVLYVGNVDANGDYYRLDLATQAETLVTTFGARVHASTAFDALTMLVALEGGEIRLLRMPPGQPATSSPFFTSDQPVTGMVRDFFDGSIYVARRDGSVLMIDDGGAATAFQTTTDPARLAIAPDGWLYALEIPPPFADQTPRVSRWQLPQTR